MLPTSTALFRVPVEKVVGFVSHDRSGAQVRWLTATGRWSDTSDSFQAVDVSGLRHKSAARRPALSSNHAEQQPRTRAGRDETRICRRCNRSAPDCTGIEGTLPGRTRHSVFIRIGTEKVGDDLLLNLAVEDLQGNKQGRLRPKERPGDARSGLLTDVVLRTDGMTLKE